MPDDQPRRGRPKGSGLDDREQISAIARMLEADPTLKPTTAIKRAGITDPSTIRRLRDKLRSEGYSRPQVAAVGREPLRSFGGETAVGTAASAETGALRSRVLTADMRSPEASSIIPFKADRGQGGLALAVASPVTDRVSQADRSVHDLVAEKPTAVAGPQPADKAQAVQAPIVSHHEAAAGAEKAPSPRAASPTSSISAALSQPASLAAMSLAAQWYALGVHIVATTAEAQTAALRVMLQSPMVASMVKHQVLLNEVAKAFCPPGTTSRKGRTTKS